jgi:hypothetical protein
MRIHNFIAMAGTILISSCGLFQAPSGPSPMVLNNNLTRVESGSKVSIISMIPNDIPNPSQAKVVNTTAFRVTDKLVSNPDGTVLIPQNAIISGVYSNDGTSCSISWQMIYNNYEAMEKNQAAMNIANKTENNSCNPKLGIRPGQLMQLIFKTGGE